VPSVCFYFQVHQPYRLRRYGVFDIGRRSDYFDDGLNELVLRRVARRCYLPMNRLLLEAIERFDGRFRVAFSITGSALEQLERWTPDALESFQALAATGAVELLAETDAHSLSAGRAPAEFDAQVALHQARLEALFGVRPRVFRNTELIFDAALAEHLERLGFAAALAEGCEQLLGWRSPHLVYAAARAPRLKLLLRSHRLSDDLAFRFGEPSWGEHPLSARKLAGWVFALDPRAQVVNLFMDYETFGEHKPAETGILELMRELPDALLEHPEVDFRTPSEVAATRPVAGALEASEPTSWADRERDLSAWLGNALQASAHKGLYELLEPVRTSGDAALLRDWRRLSASDHLHYMSTKGFEDGEVHRYFSPFESPYEAYVAFSNALCDLALRAGLGDWSPPAG
jgi:alpha-amylase